MPSLKQLQANRTNGKLWGVKTIEWKKKVSQNAFKHGLTSSRPLDEQENKIYKAILQEVQEEYSINGITETIQAERIAFYSVKIQLASRINERLLTRATVENLEVIESNLRNNIEWFSPEARQELIEHLIWFASIPNLEQAEGLSTLQRYTTSLENRRNKAIDELMKIKNFKRWTVSNDSSENMSY